MKIWYFIWISNILPAQWPSYGLLSAHSFQFITIQVFLKVFWGINTTYVWHALSEARVTPGYCPLFWCARVLAEEVVFAYSLAVVCRGPVNHQLRYIITASVHSPGVHSLARLTLHISSLLVGHMAAVHRSKRSCFQEHQDHRWVSGWWADQRS